MNLAILFEIEMILATTVVASIVSRIDTVASLASPAQGGQAPRCTHIASGSLIYPLYATYQFVL